MLDAVKKCKAAGVTPIAVGGSEKWPLQFYPALLMMRILGKGGMSSAYKGDNGGFAGPDVVKAWKMYKELCNMNPFQRGFLTTKTGEAVGFFHDAKAAFHLQAGSIGERVALTEDRGDFPRLPVDEAKALGARLPFTAAVGLTRLTPISEKVVVTPCAHRLP